jgi:hypothetical protein
MAENIQDIIIRFESNIEKYTKDLAKLEKGTEEYTEAQKKLTKEQEETGRL